jgi:hypothetical protein
MSASAILKIEYLLIKPPWPQNLGSNMNSLALLLVLLGLINCMYGSESSGSIAETELSTREDANKLLASGVTGAEPQRPISPLVLTGWELGFYASVLVLGLSSKAFADVNGCTSHCPGLNTPIVEAAQTIAWTGFAFELSGALLTMTNARKIKMTGDVAISLLVSVVKAGVLSYSTKRLFQEHLVGLRFICAASWLQVGLSLGVLAVIEVICMLVGRLACPAL